jgi:hypothetical protein
MNLHPITRLGALLAAGMGLAASAQAQNVQVRSDNADRARANVEASFKAAARGQKVGLITGRANPQPVVHADGTVEQELDAGTLSYSVARVLPNGKVEIVCVNGADEAQKAMKAPALAKRMSLAGKERSHVK